MTVEETESIGADAAMQSGVSRSHGDSKSLSWFLLRPFHACSTLRNSMVITVEPAILLFFFARFLYLPLYEQYYYVSYGAQILRNTSFPFPNGSFCLDSAQVDFYAGNGSYKVVETKSNDLVFYGQVATRIPSILVSIFLGPLSDRIGRKPIIIVAAIGTTIQGVLSVLIVHFQWSPYYFILTNFIAGMMGNFTAVLTCGLAYLSDISSGRWRGLRLGILETVYSIGGGLGLFFAGYWLQQNNCDFIPPLCLYAVCNAAVALYIAFCIPESLSKSKRRDIVSKRPKGFKSVITGIRIFCSCVPKYSAWRLWTASLINNLMALNVAGAVLLAVYFLKCPPFDLNAQMIGIYQGIQAASRALSNALLMSIFSAIKVPEAVIALVALLFHSGCDLLTGLSTKTYQVYIVAAFQGVETLSWTSMRTLMSKLVSSEDQGAMFSILASGEAFFDLIASAVWPNLFNATINHNLSAGTSFLIMAAVALIGAPFVILLLVFQQKSDYMTNSPNEEDTKTVCEYDELLRSTGSIAKPTMVDYGSTENSINR